MSFRGNGRKRNPRYILSAAFLVFAGIIALIMTHTANLKAYWDSVGIVVIFLGILMFKNANEL